MGKRNSKQKNTRHHVNSAPAIAKKTSTKAKLRNQELRSQLDNVTGLAGAANLFAMSKKTRKSEKAKKVDMEKTVEEDLSALISMKLSSTKLR